MVRHEESAERTSMLHETHPALSPQSPDSHSASTSAAAAAASPIRRALELRAAQAAQMESQVELARIHANDCGNSKGNSPVECTRVNIESALDSSSAASSSAAAASGLSPTSSSAAAPAVPPAPLSLSNALARWIPSRVLGMSYLALSAVIFSIMALFVSMLSKELPSFQIVLARCLIQFGCGLAACTYYGIDFRGPRDRWFWLGIRGTVGFLGFSAYYFAIAHLTLADATTIFFTAPLYTGILGFMFLGEKVSRADVGLTLASVVGVVFVVRPAFLFGSGTAAVDSNDGGHVSTADGNGGGNTDSSSGSSSSMHAWGLFAAVLGSLLSAFVYIAIRKVGPGVSPLVLVCAMGFSGMFLAPLGAAIQTFVWPASASTWLLLVAVGFSSFIGQIFFNAGVQKEKAAVASMVRNLDVAFSFFWQITIEGIAPSPFSVLGAVVISASVLAMGWRKWKAEEHSKSKTGPQGQPTLASAVPASEKLLRGTEELQPAEPPAHAVELEHSDVNLHQPPLVRWHS